MSLIQNNGLIGLNYIKNHSITRIVKSESADDNLHGYAVVCSECEIEKSNVPVRAMTAVVISDDSHINASPSFIGSHAGISCLERARIEIEISQSTIAYLEQLKANSKIDPNKLEVVSDEDFAEMLSECC